jgi:O-antigen ligase
LAGVELFFFYLFAVAAPLSIAALNAALGGLALFFIARSLAGKWRPGLAAWILLAWFVWEGVSALASPLRSEALGGVLNFWSWTAFFTASALPWAIRRHIGKWTKFLAVSILLTLPASLTEFLLGTDILHRQVFWQKVPVGAVNAYGYFSHHLTYAGVMSVGACFLAAAILYRRDADSGQAPGGESACGRSVLGAGTAAALAGVVMSLARSYAIGLGAALPVLLWAKGRKRVFQAGAAGVLLLSLLVIFGPASIRTRARSMWDMSNASSAERIYLWKAALDQWSQRPLMGWGPGTYAKTAGPFKAPYAQFVRYPGKPEGFKTTGHCHNLYLMVALQTGIVGLLLFLAFVAAVVRQAWLQPDPVLKWGVLAALAAFLAGGLFEYNGGDVEVAMLLFFLMGLACAKGEVSKGAESK